MTRHKACMRKHLYINKKICAGIDNDIILTDEIKDKILENRIYSVPKLTKQTKELKIINNEDLLINTGSIYLFYTRASKNADESVYKIGKTRNYLQRKEGYDKGGDMLFVVNVSNRHECENIIKDAFRKEFKIRKDYGYEYFEGDVYEMVMLIKDTLNDYIESTLVDFKY
jgi:hypothetical protein